MSRSHLAAHQVQQKHVSNVLNLIAQSRLFGVSELNDLAQDYIKLGCIWARVSQIIMSSQCNITEIAILSNAHHIVHWTGCLFDELCVSICP